VAKMLVNRYERRDELQKIIPEVQSLQSAVNSLPSELQTPDFNLHYSPFEYTRRNSCEVHNIGGHNVPRAIADFSNHDKITPASLFPIGYNYSVPLDKWNLSDQACDYIYTGNQLLNFEIPGTLGVIVNAEAWELNSGKERHYPLFDLTEFLKSEVKSDELNFVSIRIEDVSSLTSHISHLTSQPTVLVFETNNEHGMAEQRRMFIELLKRRLDIPVIIKRNYENISEEQLQLHASTDMGALLLDGFGDGLWINQNLKSQIPNLKSVNSLSFGILQATRTRISKTEYISCPSCGRTLFDLQETTAKIRSRTDHLKGVKIGIMGCIVNGPGEMADADYGYVGTGIGKITLYKGKEVVQRNIDSDKAVDALIDLIRQHGDWVEKSEALLNQ